MYMRKTIFRAVLSSVVNGQDLWEGSQVLAADGALGEVDHPPEVSEKRGKGVPRTERTGRMSQQTPYGQRDLV